MAHEYWLSDENWAVLELLIPLNHRRGVKPANNRQIISGIPANRLFEETRSETVQRLFHGRPPLSEISNGPQSGTIDAVGAVHTNNLWTVSNRLVQIAEWFSDRQRRQGAGDRIR